MSIVTKRASPYSTHPRTAVTFHPVELVRNDKFCIQTHFSSWRAHTELLEIDENITRIFFTLAHHVPLKIWQQEHPSSTSGVWNMHTVLQQSDSWLCKAIHSCASVNTPMLSRYTVCLFVFYHFCYVSVLMPLLISTTLQKYNWSWWVLVKNECWTS